MQIEEEGQTKFAFGGHHYLSTDVRRATRIHSAKPSMAYDKAGYPSAFFSVVEWLGMVIDRFGVRPAPSRTEATIQSSQPTTVEEVRVLLGYGRSFA